MARKLVELIHSGPLFALAGLYLTFRLVTALWPASWWMDANVVAFDSVRGADVILVVDRSIHRNFVADWSVVVRQHDNGNWVVWCATTGTGDYRPDAALPDPLTLDWWTNGQCARPPAGSYRISTIWTVRGRGGFPDKLIHSVSNVFTVL